MSSALRISVVIPAYRAAETIRTAVESVESQTHQPAEVILVDDASPDGSGVWMEGEFGRHNVLRLDRNSGPAGARNAGSRMACGEWIAFLDCDDAWLPWRLEEQLRALDLVPDAVLISGELAIMGNSGGCESAAQSPWASAGHPASALRRVAVADFLDENPVPTSTVLVRRETLAAVGGFDEQFRGPEDIDLWMRIAAAGPVVKLSTPLSLYRERPGSLSMDQDRFLPQILSVYRKAFAPGGALYAHRKLRRRAVAGRYVSAAWSYRECGQRAKAASLILRSWLLWPRRLRVERSQPTWRLRMLATIALGRGG
jgi:glycosyltransferase involved in cell wall biosynthesis